MTWDRYRDARAKIPGGSQLLSKRPELFLPDGWPSFYQSASGVSVVGLDGRTFIDVSHHGVGSCPLGYADPDVDAAVMEAVRAGSMSTLNCAEEHELAEVLCELHEWADQVRFARTGGEAMAIAVRVARAVTGRDVVAVGGYHGWHDWYLAANLDSADALDGQLLPRVPTAGVPATLRGTARPFSHMHDLEQLVADTAGQLAAVVLEPCRYEPPDPSFLKQVRDLCTRAGAVMIVDEITAGFRLHHGGAHLMTGVAPDLAVFAKGMSNGYPMSAVIGRRDVMEAVNRTFVSSTYWTERIGPTAALATIRKLGRENAPERLRSTGTRMQGLIREAAGQYDLDVRVKGVPALTSFSFGSADPAALGTLYTQHMLDHGYLAGGAFYPSLAHTDDVLDNVRPVLLEVFRSMKASIDAGTVLDDLRGPVAHDGLRRKGDDSK